MLTHLDLCSGIAGFAYGLQMAGGFVTKGFCEIDPFCRKVIAKHFPGVWIHEDLRSLTAELVERHCGRISILSAGFPCQPFSDIGQRKGEEDHRNLWPQIARIIFEIRPKFILLENVPNLLRFKYFGRILGDLAESGFDAEWFCVSAFDAGMPHKRERLFIVAYPNGFGFDEAQVYAGTIQAVKGLPGKSKVFARGNDSVLRPIPDGEFPRVGNGLPDRVDRYRGLGNAVVPQIVACIGRAILDLDALSRADGEGEQ